MEFELAGVEIGRASAAYPKSCRRPIRPLPCPHLRSLSPQVPRTRRCRGRPGNRRLSGELVHIGRQRHPVMFVRTPGGTSWIGKRRISEAANRNADQVGVKLHAPIQGSPAVRAEVGFEPATRVRWPAKRLRSPSGPHAVADVVRPGSEWRPSSTLACGTATDSNTTWLALAGDC